MEFSECRECSRSVCACVCSARSQSVRLRRCAAAVDAASAEGDPHRRLAFVAAFAMSNYSSTIGRIAKPFNPMLVGGLPLRSDSPGQAP